MKSCRPSNMGSVAPPSPPGPVMVACSTLKWVRLVIWPFPADAESLPRGSPRPPASPGDAEEELRTLEKASGEVKREPLAWSASAARVAISGRMPLCRKLSSLQVSRDYANAPDAYPTRGHRAGGL